MIVLASASPRRRDLLTQAGFNFIVEAANIAEDRGADEAPADFVLRLAEEKARAVWNLRPQKEWDELVVLAADTIVRLEGEVLGKPADAADARRMLLMLSGRTHQVLTGVAVLTREACSATVETTQVTFGTIDEEELTQYVASGEPMDKAGAYGIQGYAARWIPRIEGDYYNVVGLPVARVVAMLRKAGSQWRSAMDGFNLTESRLSQAPVRSEIIDKEVFHAVEWNENYFKFCEFTGFETIMPLVSSDFTNCKFTSTDWYMCLFSQSNFVECTFTDCVFRGTTFADCRFVDCVLERCRFIKDNLGGNCGFPNSAAYECDVIDGEGFELESR